jgi:hypothetical protein
VNPANTFGYTSALIQFVLSNRLVDTLWHRFIADQKINA